MSKPTKKDQLEGKTNTRADTRWLKFTHKEIEILKLALTMAEGKCFEVYQEVNKIIEGKYADSSLFKLSTDFGDLKQSIEQGELDI